MNIDGAKESVLLRDSQWHPYKQQVLHVDFQRVDKTHKIHVKVPLHFLNADVAPGVKTGGGKRHAIVMTEIDVSCLPGNLPEFIEVDLGSARSRAFHPRVRAHVARRAWNSCAHVTHENPAVASITLPKGGAV